jgi:hypothetical protein
VSNRADSFLGDKIIKRNATFFAKRYTALVNVCNGAGDGNRTHDISLEGWSFTIKLHPRIEFFSTTKSILADNSTYVYLICY